MTKQTVDVDVRGGSPGNEWFPGSSNTVGSGAVLRDETGLKRNKTITLRVRECRNVRDKEVIIGSLTLLSAACHNEMKCSGRK